jgi:hypothetical protein
MVINFAVQLLYLNFSKPSQQCNIQFQTNNPTNVFSQSQHLDKQNNVILLKAPQRKNNSSNRKRSLSLTANHEEVVTHSDANVAGSPGLIAEKGY